MATLHFICGKAASGKTTLARELAARHAAVMFGEDEWLTLLDAEINSLADHVSHSMRLKVVLAALCTRLVQLGVPMNRAKRDCACATRLSRRDSISALSAKTGSMRSHDTLLLRQIKKSFM
jgi:hypothetical protein